MILAALRQPSERPEPEQALGEIAGRGRSNLAGALPALLDGQRDEDALCDLLAPEESLIVMTILRCLADPQAEQALLSRQP